MLNRLVGR
jgi:hypothetical protein